MWEINGNKAGIGTLSFRMTTIVFFTPQFESDKVFYFFLSKGKTFNETVERFKEFSLKKVLFKNFWVKSFYF